MHILYKQEANNLEIGTIKEIDQKEIKNVVQQQSRGKNVIGVYPGTIIDDITRLSIRHQYDTKKILSDLLVDLYKIRDGYISTEEKGAEQ